MPSLDSKESIETALREFARTRDGQVRSDLITSHLGLAEQLAKRYANRSESYDDLLQAASIGLIKAVEGFKPELGFEFSAYATKTIIGELKRHFRDRGWSIRAPRRVQELYVRLGQTVEELSQHLGRSPTIAELAHEMAASEEEVIEAFEAAHAYRSTSLDGPGFEGDTIGDRLGSEDAGFDHVLERTALLPLVAGLPERERLIVTLRFVDELTQSEIATRLGLSQMQISRLLARSLSTLRQAYLQDL